MSTDTSGLFACRPILSVKSVPRSIDYYVRALGFHLGWAWSNAGQRFLQPGEAGDPGFALVGRGGVQLMLSEGTQGAPGMWLHLDVDTARQLDAVCREWERQGAQIIEPPSVRPWGMYEMRVRDPDGHVLRVSSPPHRSEAAEPPPTSKACSHDAEPAGEGPTPAARWLVRRMDDNGNAFVVHAGMSREDADRLVAEFAARGHKQLYWEEPEVKGD